MGRSASVPRGNLRDGKRTYHAGFGARHPIEYDRNVADFFNQLDERWGAILPERDRASARLAGLAVSRYALYDDPDKIGMTVLERRLSAETAKRHRLEWNANDVGRLKGQIEDEIGRLSLPLPPWEMTLTTAIRVGDADRRSAGGKFALVAEVEDKAAGMLASEHEIVVNGLGGVFKGFVYPYDEFVPKMTVGRVFRGAEPAQVEACAQELGALLQENPLTVSLQPVVFFAHQEL